MSNRTLAQIAADIDITELPDYRLKLVYIDYRDAMSAEQVEHILREGWDDHADEWISDCQHMYAPQLADDLFHEAASDGEYEEHENEWGPSDERLTLIESIIEADTSDPYRDLLRQTGPMLFRVSPDEDHMAFLDPDDLSSPEEAAEALGLGPEWLPAVTEILPEIEGYAAEGGAYFGATIVFSAHPADLVRHPEDTIVQVESPFLWLCNPWAGNGWGEVAEGVTARIPLADIHVDSEAWGYSANTVYGGLSLDESDITIATKEAA